MQYFVTSLISTVLFFRITFIASPVYQSYDLYLLRPATATECFFCFVSSFQSFPMSCATLIASNDAPDRPFLVKPTAYSPSFPFHPFGKGATGMPSLVKNSFS